MKQKTTIGLEPSAQAAYFRDRFFSRLVRWSPRTFQPECRPRLRTRSEESGLTFVCRDPCHLCPAPSNDEAAGFMLRRFSYFPRPEVNRDFNGSRVTSFVDRARNHRLEVSTLQGPVHQSAWSHDRSGCSNELSLRRLRQADACDSPLSQPCFAPDGRSKSSQRPLRTWPDKVR